MQRSTMIQQDKNEFENNKLVAVVVDDFLLTKGNYNL